MDAGLRQELIEQYREGPAVVEELVGSLSEEDLDHAPADGGWTPRQVVHHLADSEMTSAIRVRKLLAEDEPVIQGYDEGLFAERLHYETRPVAGSLVALRAARESTSDLLDLLQEDDWSRSGTHTESGPGYTVERWLEIYAAHAHDHAEQIRQAVDG